jgi:ABC-type phosphate transport system substrate-binding protein
MDRLLTGATSSQLAITEHKTSAELAEAIAADKGGLGLVGDEHAHWPGVKRLPLSIPANAAPLADAVVGSDRTPDCRPLFLAVAVPKDGSMSPQLREMMEYVLSYSGQLDVAKDGLLPLTRGEIHAQKDLLGWSMAR